MIFRRLKAHVEKENWFAVGIDFAIVVVGVFVGLQVANWNAAQQAEAANQLYLDRIARDVETDIERLQDSRMGWASIMSRAADNEAFLSGNDIPGKSQWDSLMEIHFSAGWSPFAPNRTTYDELVASGQFAGLANFELRQAITTYYAALEEGERFYDFNPRLRSLVRGKYDTPVHAHLWQACFSEALYRELRDGIKPCPAPDDPAPLDAIATALREDPDLLAELRFTYSIRLIAQTIADEDSLRAETLAQEIRDYTP